MDKFFADVNSKLKTLYQPPPGEYSEATKILLQDLTAHRTTENAEKVDKIIEKAKREEYNDMLSDEFAPIIGLVDDLRDAGLDSLVEEAKDGKYDG